jgi:hypothetical protein
MSIGITRGRDLDMAERLDRFAKLMASTLTRRRLLAKVGAGLTAGLAGLVASRSNGSARTSPTGFTTPPFLNAVLVPPPFQVNEREFSPPAWGLNEKWFPPGR